MRRDGHNRAGAIRHQDIIRYKNRDFGPVDGIDAADALQADACLILDKLGAFKVGFLGRLLLVGAHRVQISDAVRPLFDIRMLGRDDHIRRAEQRVRARCINGQRIAGRRTEMDLRACRTADPVAL